MGPPPAARARRGGDADRAGRRALLGVRVQDSGEHGSAPPRPRRVRAHLLREVRARHDRAQRAHRQGRAAHARDEAVRQRSRIGRRRLRRRRRRPGEPGHVRDRRHAVPTAPGDRASIRSRPSSRNISRWSAVSTPRATNRFRKGIAQLREEGAIQVFYPYGQTRTEPILAAVGAAAVRGREVSARIGIQREDRALDAAVLAGAPRARRRATRSRAAQMPSNAKLVEDWDGAPLALFESEWSMRLAAGVESALTFEPFAARGLAPVAP